MGRRILYAIIFFGALIALDFYVFQGYKMLVKKWIPDYSKILYYTYWAIPIVLYTALFISLFASNSPTVRSNVARWIFSILVAVYLAKIIWMIFIAADDIRRFVRFLFSASDMPNEAMMDKMSRSDFLITTGLLGAGAMFGSLVYGVIGGAHRYSVKRKKLHIKDLAEGLEGLKIVQISDIHSGSFWSPEAVKEGIELVVKEQADMIFFTGDLVNDRATEFDSFKSDFARIQAPLGVYSILGNHDYGDYVSWPDQMGTSKEENLERLKTHHKDIGWRLLLNEHEKIRYNNAELAIIGVENWSANLRFPKHGRLKEAYTGTDGVDLKLLLSHDPSHWRAEVLKEYKDIKVTFSGHTHGMQFGVNTKYYRWSPVQYIYPEWADLYTEGDQHLYVNTGFGYLGYPGRVGFYPEITVFELTSA